MQQAFLWNSIVYVLIVKIASLVESSDISLSPVMEGFVILKKNPEYDEDDIKK